MKKRQYDMTARAAKAEQTKERIVESAVALYYERPLDDFTLEAVADRAETTIQTVLRVFESKDKLILAALNRMAETGTGLKPTPPGDVEAAVSAYFDLYETIGDFLIRRLADERRHPSLKPSLDVGRTNHRDGVLRTFAPQLARFRGSARAQIYNLLVVATDVYVWKLLRRDLALSRSAAEAAACKIITSVTDTENRNGTNPLVELVGRR